MDDTQDEKGYNGRPGRPKISLFSGLEILQPIKRLHWGQAHGGAGRSMPDYKEIYNTQARAYDLLVAREDYQGNLWPALRGIRPLDRLDVVELGAGTGRLTCMLAAAARRIRAFDLSRHMLEAARAKLSASGLRNWRLGVADNRRLPLRDRCADLSIAGWSLGHFVGWYPQTWRDEIGAALAGMRRVLRPGGTLILLETLGTGEEVPRPPDEGLAAYYRLLEETYGFSSTWIRTDYRFQDLDEAVALIRFFFGDPLAERVAAEGSTIVPECTGIWWLHV
jgi:ubiquinone/menaquinone biosynthesis C-methylase UbiE